MSALLQNEIGQLIENIGVERIVLGTGMPFKYPDPSLLKLEVLDISEEEKEMIRWENAAKLLEDSSYTGVTQLRSGYRYLQTWLEWL